jgi:hypothetical protein
LHERFGLEQGAVEARAWKTPDYGGRPSGAAALFRELIETTSARGSLQLDQSSKPVREAACCNRNDFASTPEINNNPQVTVSAIVMAHDAEEARTIATALFKELHLDGAVVALPKATIRLAAS